MAELPALSALSLGPEDPSVAVHDAVLRVQRYAGDPAALSALLEAPPVDRPQKELHAHHGGSGDEREGAKGVGDFFASHRCNSVCQLLGLPR